MSYLELKFEVESVSFQCLVKSDGPKKGWGGVVVWWWVWGGDGVEWGGVEWGGVGWGGVGNNAGTKS